MGRNNTNLRGFSSHAMRKLRLKLYVRSTNRRRNQEACERNNIIKEEKSRLWRTQQTEK
jgi:hypothetical protein